MKTIRITIQNRKTGKLCAILLMLLVTARFSGGDEPQSTIHPSGDQYSAYNADDPADGEIDLSTSETPTPNCPDDQTDGDPDYYWDFGPLDGVDNGDGTANIYTDVDGNYDVTVYCQQQFIDGDGNDYTEDTLTSVPGD